MGRQRGGGRCLRRSSCEQQPPSPASCTALPSLVADARLEKNVGGAAAASRIQQHLRDLRACGGGGGGRSVRGSQGALLLCVSLHGSAAAASAAHPIASPAGCSRGAAAAAAHLRRCCAGRARRHLHHDHSVGHHAVGHHHAHRHTLHALQAGWVGGVCKDCAAPSERQRDTVAAPCLLPRLCTTGPCLASSHKPLTCMYSAGTASGMPS